MSWMQRGTDERLVKAMQTRRDVQRGPLPREGSVYSDELLTPSRIYARAFGVSTLFLVILVVLMTAATVYYAEYSGALRWLVFAGVLSVIGFVAVRVVGAAVQDPLSLRGLRTPANSVGGDLKSLRTTLSRAEGGLTYSQLLFEDAMRSAFLEKVRIARNLSSEEIAAAMKRPETLNGILGDRELTIFLLESARNSRMYPTSLPQLPKRVAFARRVATILDRMEAWR